MLHSTKINSDGSVTAVTQQVMGRAKASMPAMGTLRCSRLLLNNNKGEASFLSVSVNSFFFKDAKLFLEVLVQVN